MRLTILLVFLLVWGCGQEPAPPSPLPPAAGPSGEPKPLPVPAAPKILESHPLRAPKMTPPPPANSERERTRSGMKDMMDHMARANMVFSLPDRANIDTAILATLDIDLVRSLDEMERQLRGRMPAAKGNIAVTKVMEAHLTSSSFRVIPITPERQPLSAKNATRWQWELDTNRGGPHQVNLAINAVITVEGERLQKTIQVYERTMMVEITARQHIKRFVSANWQWLWGVLFMPVVIAGWRWFRRPANSGK